MVAVQTKIAFVGLAWKPFSFSAFKILSLWHDFYIPTIQNYIPMFFVFKSSMFSCQFFWTKHAFLSWSVCLFISYMWIYFYLKLYLSIYLLIYLSQFMGCPRGVMVNAMDCGIVVNKFVLQSCYYVHFQVNTLGKGMNPPYPPNYGLNSTTNVLLGE